jgi:hypothetical protein
MTSQNKFSFLKFQCKAALAREIDSSSLTEQMLKIEKALRYLEDTKIIYHRLVNPLMIKDVALFRREFNLLLCSHVVKKDAQNPSSTN